MKGKVISAVTITLILVMAFFTPLVRGNPDGSGVSVINVSPKIQSAHLEKENGLFNLTLIASDYNGWLDILTVNASIYNSNEQLVSSYGYRQYKQNETRYVEENVIDKFFNKVGGALVVPLSKTKRVNESSIEGRTEMAVEFHFDLDGGWIIQLEIQDTWGMICDANIEFPSFMRGVYNITPISLLAAVIVSVYISYKVFGKIKDLEVQ